LSSCLVREIKEISVDFLVAPTKQIPNLNSGKVATIFPINIHTCTRNILAALTVIILRTRNSSERRAKSRDSDFRKLSTWKKEDAPPII